MEQAVGPYEVAGNAAVAAWLVTLLVFSVQLFGSGATMRSIPHFPPFWITTSVLGVLSALWYLLNRKCDALRAEGGATLREALAPMKPHDVPHFHRLAASSPRVGNWHAHVQTVLKRELCAGDMSVAHRLEKVEATESAITAQDRLHGHVLLEGAQAPTVEELLEAVRRPDGPRDDLLQAMLHDSDAVLTAMHQQAMANAQLLDARRKRWDPLLACCFYCAPGALLTFVPVLWQALTLTPAPLLVAALGGLGTFCFACAVLPVFANDLFGNRESLDAYHLRRERELGLGELDGRGCHEMLSYLPTSPAAQSWHRFVTQVRKRRYRWQDLFYVRELVHQEERARRTCA
jgi:hypothetical protein